MNAVHCEYNDQRQGVRNAGDIITLREGHRLDHLVGKWQKRGELESSSDPKDVAKVLLSFFHGFIVQSALLGELDPETVTRGMKGLLGEGVAAKRDIHARSSTRMPSSRK